MEYEQTIETVAMIDGPPPVIIRPLPMTEDPQIQRIRKYLFVILGVFFGLSLIYTIYVLFTLILSIIAKDRADVTMEWWAGLFPLIVYGFGIFVAYKYWATGLRVFAWLSIILPILAAFGILINIIFIMIISRSSSRTQNDKRGGYLLAGTTGMIIERVIFAAVYVLTILMILPAFKLARLIDVKSSLAK